MLEGNSRAAVASRKTGLLTRPRSQQKFNGKYLQFAKNCDSQEHWASVHRFDDDYNSPIDRRTTSLHYQATAKNESKPEDDSSGARSTISCSVLNNGVPPNDDTSASSAGLALLNYVLD